MLLTTGCRVDGGSVEHDDIWLVAIKHILENIKNLGIEVKQIVIVVEDHLGLWKMGSVVEDVCRFLGRSLLF